MTTDSTTGQGCGEPPHHGPTSYRPLRARLRTPYKVVLLLTHWHCDRRREGGQGNALPSGALPVFASSRLLHRRSTVRTYSVRLAASASALPLCTHATHTCPRLTVTRVIVRTDRLAPRVLPQAPAAATTPAAAPIATVAAAVQPLSSAPPPSSA